jgi:hypothetical protein
MKFILNQWYIIVGKCALNRQMMLMIRKGRRLVVCKMEMGGLNEVSQNPQNSV